MRDIPGFQSYSITDGGRIWSKTSNRWLVPYRDKDGYRRIKIFSDSGTRVTKGIHDLVLRAWVGEPEGGHVPNHKNGIRDDNVVQNLEWLTVSGNTKDGYARGTHKAPWSGVFGKSHPGHGHIGARRFEINLPILFAMIWNGNSFEKTARKIGCSKLTVMNYLKGVHWQCREGREVTP